jgi:hypothetical protein
MSLQDAVEAHPKTVVTVTLGVQVLLVRAGFLGPDAAWAAAGVASVLSLGGGYLVLRRFGYELTGGRCRAETEADRRCKLSRPPNRDLCHVHQRTHGTVLHPDGVAEKTGERADTASP